MLGLKLNHVSKRGHSGTGIDRIKLMRWPEMMVGLCSENGGLSLIITDELLQWIVMLSDCVRLDTDDIHRLLPGIDLSTIK